MRVKLQPIASNQHREDQFHLEESEAASDARSGASTERSELEDVWLDVLPAAGVEGVWLLVDRFEAVGVKDAKYDFRSFWNVIISNLSICGSNPSSPRRRW